MGKEVINLAKSPIRWLVHLRNGETIVDGGKTEVEEINPEDISSIELLGPDKRRITVCSSPVVNNFQTLVTCTHYVDFRTRQQVTREEERILSFDVGDTKVTLTLNCLTNNIKLSFSKGGR